MKSNYDKAFSYVIASEGGYVCNKNDNGGETCLGVTKAAWAAYLGRPIADGEMKALTPDIVKPFYKSQYWDKVKGDDLPSGVDYQAFDFAVNAGVGQSAKFVQRAVGAIDDGAIGPATIDLVNKANPRTVILGITNQKEAFYRGIVEKNPSQSVFLNGWLNRCKDVEAKALAMV
jgi:lysozyme family protein